MLEQRFDKLKYVNVSPISEIFFDNKENNVMKSGSYQMMCRIYILVDSETDINKIKFIFFINIYKCRNKLRDVFIASFIIR